MQRFISVKPFDGIILFMFNLAILFHFTGDKNLRSNWVRKFPEMLSQIFVLNISDIYNKIVKLHHDTWKSYNFCNNQHKIKFFIANFSKI